MAMPVRPGVAVGEGFCFPANGHTTNDLTGDSKEK